MVTHRQELERLGFVGFVRFSDLMSGDVPTTPGVYAVLRTSVLAPTYLDASPAGWFKDRDPSVPVEKLSAAWVQDVEVIYLGKATGGANGNRGLRKRLTEYVGHGSGRPVGHWGGRYVWQLADSADLLVAWMTTPGEDPGVVESRLIAQFQAKAGALPFANLRR